MPLSFGDVEAEARDFNGYYSLLNTERIAGNLVKKKRSLYLFEVWFGCLP